MIFSIFLFARNFQISEFQALCSVLASRKHWQGQCICSFFKEFGRNEILGFLAHGGLLTYSEDPKPYEALIPTKADLQSPQALNGKTPSPKKPKPKKNTLNPKNT